MKSRHRTMQALLPWLVIVAAIGLWEFASDVFAIPQFVLPAPHAVAASFVQDWRPLFLHGAHTLMTTLIGFALAIIVGMLLGLAIGASALAYKGLYPLLIAFNSVPKVALLPILIIWFGAGTLPAAISSFLLAFFPIVVNVSTGIATTEPELEDVLRSLRAKRRQILWKISIPRSLPYLFASLKVALTLAFVGSVMSETIASNWGIGYLMITATSRFDVPLVFAGLVLAALMGIAMYLVCAFFEARMTRWAFRGSR